MIGRWKAVFATPFLRRLLGRPDPLVVRREMAHKYIRGRGIEVGPGHMPLALPEGVTVTYVDCELADGVDVVGHIETLTDFEDENLDFVIANHVLEHVENPIRALLSVKRVLRRDGIAFIALPNKQHTFDKSRPVTELAHIVRDFGEGPEWSRRAHLREWAEKVERLPREQIEKRIEELSDRIYVTHVHVWDPPAMGQMFGYMARYLMPIYMSQTRGELLRILRKINLPCLRAAGE